jgi:hypothetical protein
MIARERRGNFNPGWHDRLAEPISAVGLEAWRERLEPAEVALIEHATGRHFERFGYRPDPNVDVTAKPLALLQLARQRTARRIKWSRYALGEAKRQRLYRHPLARQRLPGELV